MCAGATHSNYTTIKEPIMTTVNAADARTKLPSLIDQAASGQPVQIKGEHSSAVLVGEDEWRSIQETLYLLSIPGMRESIVEGMNAPAEKYSKDLDW